MVECGPIMPGYCGRLCIEAQDQRGARGTLGGPEENRDGAATQWHPPWRGSHRDFSDGAALPMSSAGRVGGPRRCLRTREAHATTLRTLR